MEYFFAFFLLALACVGFWVVLNTAKGIHIHIHMPESTPMSPEDTAALQKVLDDEAERNREMNHSIDNILKELNETMTGGATGGDE